MRRTGAGWEAERAALVAELSGYPELTDARVLRALAAIPRHRFVPPELARHAYLDAALAIGAGQTISQPFMVAFMAQALDLQPTDRVLEVGTGSGYQAAVLSRLCDAVTSVEILPDLSRAAQERLRALGITNVNLVVGDGGLGWPAGAPYDAILVTAGGDRLPPPLLDQLAAGGRLVAPVGARDLQVLTRWRKELDGSVFPEELLACTFVPLTGVHGRGM